MFEKVLKSLCPCYYKRHERSHSSGCLAGPNKAADAKRLSRSSVRDFSGPVYFGTENESVGDGQKNWKGTLNLIQPQPLYAFPTDSVKKIEKNLLKPPLYWKKTTKTLHPVGPPVFQECKIINSSSTERSCEKKERLKHIPIKHSRTVANVTNTTSASTVEVRWLKSQSLHNISSETSDMKVSFKKNRHGGDEKEENCKKIWPCSKCKVLSDVSHGVILFTVAYFNKKKVCMINIDRLENLSKKGRDGNSYYTVVKLAILPSEKYIKCSKILANCSSPDVNEDFSFSIRELTGKILRLSVFDASLQKLHEAVGHALLTLEDVMSEQPKKYRVKLYRRTQPHTSPGDLYLSLKYSQSLNKLTITAHKAKNLHLQRDRNAKLNTYVKVTLFCYGEKVKSKKSVVVLDSHDPSYNTSFTFPVRKDQIDQLSLTVTVRMKGFVNDLTIGRLNFGPFFYGDTRKHTPWGRLFLKKECVTHWFRMYL